MVLPYNRVRLQGTMPGGEVWSVNPAFMGDFDDLVTSYEDLLFWAENIEVNNGGTIVPQELLSLMSNAVAFTSIRTEYYDSTGKLNMAAEVNISPAYVGTGAATKPYQAAVVLSLRTGRPGRSYRGRLFWPAQAAVISGTTLRMSQANQQSIATAAALMLQQLAGAAPEGANILPAVVSQTLGSNARVTTVEVGDILDVQRRRRDAVAENYASAVVGGPA